MSRLAAVIACCLAIAGTGFIHTKLPPTTNVDRGEAFVPDPTVAKTLAMGFDALVADYYWLQAIQAIGGDAGITPELGKHLGKLIDVVTTLDPWVGHPYRFAAVWLTESEENVRTANRLLRRGIEHHPEEWRNLFYLGFNHFFYLLENEKAADALERASELPGSPAYLPRLVARLRSHTADIDVAEAFLIQQINGLGENDGAAKAVLRRALDEIEVEKKARFLDRARAAYKALNGRDIEKVEDLVSGDHPMLELLPSPEPDSLPPSLSKSSRWVLDREKDRIHSSYYGGRYELHYSIRDHKRAEQWRDEREAAEADSEVREMEASSDAS